MKSLFPFLLILVLVGCSSRPPKTYPLEALLNPDLVNRDVSDLNAIDITGNAHGVVTIYETRLTVKGDQIYQSDTEMLSGTKLSDTTTVWSPPISAKLRSDNYKKVYELVTKCRGLFDNGTFDQFFAQAASEPDRTLLALNGKGDTAHVGIGYDYTTGKINVRTEKGFPQMEVLHQLFPTAEFKDSADQGVSK
jgi:hypothetical protein